MPEPSTTPNPPAAQPPAQTPPASVTPATWDEYLKDQPAEIQALYQNHTTGLTNTVKATRDERDALSKQLKDLLPKAEKGSELEKSLTEALGKIEVAERRAAFAEEAIKPEVGCTNSKAAFLIAQADSLFDRRGNPDWAAIRAAAPELFQKKQGKANGGDGTGDEPAKTTNMNDLILRKAGRV
jgi:hypothetical protein